MNHRLMLSVNGQQPRQGHQLQFLWMFPADFWDASHPFFHTYIHNILGATHATHHKPIVPSLGYVPYCKIIVIGGLEQFFIFHNIWDNPSH